ncbi:MAG: response regulator receiver protein [Magnetococcales bacterium]|nr:response regulator receiver protein [Magnetococcales bacterium]HIJ84739.1 response regulator [Magnetococcales bacterium]
MAQILIVDDDHTIRAYLRAILEGEDGHQLQEAQDGAEGIRLYRAHPFDLVITDILMPIKDGVELIMEMTETFPGVRIVAMSGGGRGLEASFNLDMAKDFGAVRVMTKPFSPEDVRRAVADVLDVAEK